MFYIEKEGFMYESQDAKPPRTFIKVPSISNSIKYPNRKRKYFYENKPLFEKEDVILFIMTQ